MTIWTVLLYGTSAIGCLCLAVAVWVGLLFLWEAATERVRKLEEEIDGLRADDAELRGRRAKVDIMWLERDGVTAILDRHCRRLQELEERGGVPSRAVRVDLPASATTGR